MSEQREWTIGETIPETGNWVCLIDKIPFYFFINVKKGKHLFISLTAANGPLERVKPFYSRWKYSDIANGSFLCVDDPMIWQYGLKVGWFFGNKDNCYAFSLVELIKDICSKLDISLSDVIFLSSSSGGTGSIMAGSYLANGCKVVAINPQICLEKYPAFKKLGDSNIIDLDNFLNDSFERNDLCHLMAKSDAHFILCMNQYSEPDREESDCLFSRLNISLPNQYLTNKSSIHIWKYKANGINSPHQCMDFMGIFPQLTYIADNIEQCETEEFLEYVVATTDNWENHFSVIMDKFYKKIISNLFDAKKSLSEELFNYHSKYAKQHYYGFTIPYASLYVRGICVKKDLTMAANILRSGIDDGSDDCIRSLCIVLWAIHDNKSILELRKIVDSKITKNADVYYYGGISYTSSGDGSLETDLMLAKKYLHIAYDNNVPHSMIKLCDVLISMGGYSNYHDAEKMLLPRAYNGDTNAMLRLGILYHKQSNSDSNSREKSKQWLYKSSEGGNQKAKKLYSTWYPYGVL